MNIIFLALVGMGIIFVLVGLILIYPVYSAHGLDRGPAPSTATPVVTPEQQKSNRNKYYGLLIGMIVAFVLGFIMIGVGVVVEMMDSKRARAKKLVIHPGVYDHDVLHADTETMPAVYRPVAQTSATVPVVRRSQTMPASIRKL